MTMVDQRQLSASSLRPDPTDRPRRILALLDEMMTFVAQRVTYDSLHFLFPAWVSLHFPSVPISAYRLF